jgi:hypothetical protein
MRASGRAWDALASIGVTISCLATLMLLVVACTFAQVRLGTLGAVDLYMRSWFVWMPLGGVSIPIFPGGALVGLVLGVNLAAALLRRMKRSWRKAGLWLVHTGLVLLVAGEFASASMQVESRLAIEEGETKNWVERAREPELVLVDTADPTFDDVYGIREAALARGGTIALPGTSVSLRVKRWVRNGRLVPPGAEEPDAGVTLGPGAGLAVRELPPVTSDDEVDLSIAVVEVSAAGRSLGTWLASSAIDVPQQFYVDGRTWTLALRPRREYLPYSITLEEFRHDVYPGTDIPKNFSSLVRLRDGTRREDRDVLIYMNQPLRHGGKAFYQASFGKNDTLSILQVVENPGWLLPYVSTVLVGVGLLVHFAISLRRGARRAGAAREA